MLQLINSKGWEELEGYILSNLNNLSSNLAYQKFESLEQVTQIQGEIQGMSKILGYVREGAKAAKQGEV